MASVLDWRPICKWDAERLVVKVADQKSHVTMNLDYELKII